MGKLTKSRKYDKGLIALLSGSLACSALNTFLGTEGHWYDLLFAVGFAVGAATYLRVWRLSETIEEKKA